MSWRETKTGEGGHSKQLRLAVETEEERRARRMMQLPNCSGWPWRRTKKEKQDWKTINALHAQYKQAVVM